MVTCYITQGAVQLELGSGNPKVCIQPTQDYCLKRGDKVSVILIQQSKKSANKKPIKALVFKRTKSFSANKSLKAALIEAASNGTKLEMSITSRKSKKKSKTFTITSLKMPISLR
jgi:hypothetical protein